MRWPRRGTRDPGRRASRFTGDRESRIEISKTRDLRLEVEVETRDTVPARGKEYGHHTTRRGRNWEWQQPVPCTATATATATALLLREEHVRTKAAVSRALGARLGGGSLASWSPCSACLDQVSEREEGEGKVRYSRHKAQAQAHAHSTRTRQQGRLADTVPSYLYKYVRVV